MRENLTDLGVSYVNNNPRTAAGDHRNRQTHAELPEFGSKDQIPFLVDTDHEVTLYESTDIVEHLEEHHA